MAEGLIHLYCGDGKGKTTAALGLAVRFAGTGKKVFIVQFFKTMDSSELVSLKHIPEIEICRNSIDFSFFENMSDSQLEAVTEENNRNLALALDKMNSGLCDMLVLDEIVGCYNYNLIDKKAVDLLLKEKRPDMELVLTGIYPPESFISAADYITSMTCLRHPFEKGIPARRGIEF